MASSIPAFKAALVNRLRADGRFSVVDVMYGLPAVSPGQDAVLVGNTRPDDPTRESMFAGGQSQWLGGGSTPCREERYVLEVLISVARPWRSEQQATTSKSSEAFIVSSNESMCPCRKPANATLNFWLMSFPFF